MSPMLLGMVQGAILAGQLLSRAGAPLPDAVAGQHRAYGGGHVPLFRPGRRSRLRSEQAGSIQSDISRN